MVQLLKIRLLIIDDWSLEVLAPVHLIFHVDSVVRVHLVQGIIQQQPNYDMWRTFTVTGNHEIEPL